MDSRRLAQCNLIAPQPAPEPNIFDLLNDESAENVIRFVSDKPRSRNWDEHIYEDEMSALLESGGQVLVTSRRVLSAFHSDPKWKKIRVTRNVSVAEMKNLRRLYCKGGQYFVTVHLDESFPPSLFGMYFPNLKNLYMTSDRPLSNFDVLKNCKQESLSLNDCSLDDRSAKEMEDHCRDLRTLEVRYQRIGSTFDDMSGATLVPWRI